MTKRNLRKKDLCVWIPHGWALEFSVRIIISLPATVSETSGIVLSAPAIDWFWWRKSFLTNWRLILRKNQIFAVSISKEIFDETYLGISDSQIRLNLRVIHRFHLFPSDRTSVGQFDMNRNLCSKRVSRTYRPKKQQKQHYLLSLSLSFVVSRPWVNRPQADAEKDATLNFHPFLFIQLKRICHVSAFMIRIEGYIFLMSSNFALLRKKKQF